MKSRICMFVLLMIVISTVLPVASFAEENRSDEAALREIKETLWPRAYATRYVDLLDSILADEFRMVDADGNWSSKAEGPYVVEYQSTNVLIKRGGQWKAVASHVSGIKNKDG